MWLEEEKPAQVAETCDARLVLELSEEVFGLLAPMMQCLGLGMEHQPATTITHILKAVANPSICKARTFTKANFIL
jgi:hypothetical protein